MKIKKIAALCKKTRRIIVSTDENGVQWIGNGFAMYPLFGMPIMAQENIYTIFDITDKQAGKIYFSDSSLDTICLDDNCENENLLKENETKLIIADKTIQSYQTSNGIAFIDVSYLGPIEDIEILSVYERISTEGKIYFAIKAGLILYGIIMPYDCISENLVNEIKFISEQCKIAFDNKENKKS